MRDIFDYRLVVFDLDGTLYRQGLVRRRMLAEILAVGDPPGRLARLRILGRFRRLREALASEAPKGFDSLLFTRLSRETGRDEMELRALVAEWMERRPLAFLPAAIVPGARELFRALCERGVQVAVWSDYPVIDKLDALGLKADHRLFAGAPEIDALKPDPAGLAFLMRAAGASCDETLMVGDRTSRDGAAARALGVDFLLRADAAPKAGADQARHVRDFREFLERPGAPA